jgi:DNA-binding protein H-NS
MYDAEIEPYTKVKKWQTWRGMGNTPEVLRMKTEKQEEMEI